MTNAKRIALSYTVTAVVFLALDFVWLSLTSSRLYQPVLSPHLSGRYDWGAVAVFYPLYFIGITVFVVRPLQKFENRLAALARAVLFGVVAYGTYDLTNQATLSGWPWMLTMIDMVWGGVITSCATLASRAALKKWG
jgi:uncharacterized membrane protein